MSRGIDGFQDRRLKGGVDVFDDVGQPAGVLGLLVTSGEPGAVFAVTHASAGTPRRGPAVGLSDHAIRLAGNIANDPPPPVVTLRGFGARNICCLVGLFPVPSGVKISATVASLKGLGVVQPPLSILKVLPQTLRLVVGQSHTEWQIKTWGTMVAFEGQDGVKQIYSDAVICRPIKRKTAVAGLGGAVFFTPDGHPVGMLVGERDGHAIMAPLRPVMWRAGLAVLDDAGAAIFNGKTAFEREIAVSDRRPSAQAWELAREYEPPVTAELPHARARSYRFALFDLRSAPQRAELDGLDLLTSRLPRSTARKGVGSNRTPLRRWVLAGARRHAEATTSEAMRVAFEPLVLAQPDRPAREIMAALSYLDEFKPVQVSEIAARYLRSPTRRVDIRLRTTLWWLVQDYLARRTAADVPFEVALTLYRAVSVRLELGAQQLRAESHNRELERELFAMIEAALALPPATQRTSLMHTMMLRLRTHAPQWAAFCATRAVIESLRDVGGVDAAGVLHEHAEFISEVRAYENSLAHSLPHFESRFDDRLSYLLTLMNISKRDQAAAFAELAAIGTRFRHPLTPNEEYFELEIAKTREAFTRLRIAA